MDNRSMSSVTGFSETVAVSPQHVSAVLHTLVEGRTLGHVLPALSHVVDAVMDQVGQDEAWVLPAADVWQLAYNADALSAYELDETDAASYDLPQVVAQHALVEAVRTQAPRTYSALMTLADAEMVLLLAEHRTGM